MPSEVKPVGREQALEAAKPVTDYRGYCQMCGEPDVITRHNLKQPTPPPDAAWAREFVERCFMAKSILDVHQDSRGKYREVIDSLTAELSAMVQAELAAVRGELLCLRTCEECKVRYDRASGAKCLCGVSRLESERDEAVKLLRPFAAICVNFPESLANDSMPYYAAIGDKCPFNLGDSRRAAAFLTTHDAARSGRGEGENGTGR